MNLNNKIPQMMFFVLTSFLFMFTYSSVFANTEQAAQNNKNINKPLKHLSKESGTCISCHKKETPSIYQQWGESKHYTANVGCYECHKASPTAKDAIRHKDFIISVIVSPKKCSTCHEREVKEFTNSHHAKAGQIIGSLDNVLAEVVEGGMVFNGKSPVAVSGCWQCHGSAVKVLPNGSYDPTTWPNDGIGRINPDGSKGACTACHQRHVFSVAQARRPETCANCHLGPDHPQKEIYDSSKHGIAYYSNIGKMNLSSPKWIVGEDYSVAPNCATCHMGATPTLSNTHDVGDRISWLLRPPISEKYDAKAIASGKHIKTWQQRRADMKNVCSSCHGQKIVKNFYIQYDNVVELYNNKFARPGTDIMAALTKYKLIPDIPFANKVQWTWFRIWHHSGRRARQGASMMAPDFVQWHGMFEVAEHFYSELIPEVRILIREAREAGNIKGADAVQKLLDKEMNSPLHSWYIGKTPANIKAIRKKERQQFNKRYLEESK